MKKAFVISALMLTCLTVFESCKKSEDVVTSAATTTEATVTVALKANQSYSYTLPANSNKKPYRILKASSQNATTEIVADASGNMQLVYTPALNFIGTDAIALTTAPSDTCEGHKPPHHGEHPGGHHGLSEGKPQGDNQKIHHGRPHPKKKLPFLHKKKCNNEENTTETIILIHFNITSDETISTVN
ncbi:MAG TPA: hypothetical protein PK323_02955 [Bacteroidia bacterium]|nr:hypothetical protein [Bacteroidia bacterium]